MINFQLPICQYQGLAAACEFRRKSLVPNQNPPPSTQFSPSTLTLKSINISQGRSVHELGTLTNLFCDDCELRFRSRYKKNVQSLFSQFFRVLLADSIGAAGDYYVRFIQQFIKKFLIKISRNMHENGDDALWRGLAVTHQALG